MLNKGRSALVAAALLSIPVWFMATWDLEGPPPSEIELVMRGGPDSAREYLLAERSQEELNTVLFTAVKRRKIEIVKLLVAAGADPTVTRQGDSLFVLVASGWGDQVEVADLVLELGADICAVSDEYLGRRGSLADHARSRDNVVIAEWLETESTDC